MDGSKEKPTIRRRGRYFSSLMRWLRFACVLLIIFDFTTTVFFSVKAMKGSSQDTIERTESQISQYIQSVWNLGDAIAAAPTTRDNTLSLRERARRLVPYADAYGLFMLGITNEKGLLGSTLDRKQITSTEMLTDEGIGDLSSRPAFQEMMATGNSILTDTYLAGADAETLIYTIWIPYYIDDQIAGAITVSIKFDYINNIITSTSLKDDYYFTLIDSQNKVSANGNVGMVDVPLDEAYQESSWVSISLNELKNRLDRGHTGGYWGINNNRLEYVTYMPVTGTPWKLVMRTDFFGSFRNTFFSLAIKLVVYLALLVLFSLRKSRDAITRERLFNMMTGNVDEVFLAYNLKQRRMEYASGNSMRVLGIPAEEWLSHPKQASAGFGISMEKIEKKTVETAYSIDTKIHDNPDENERLLRFRIYKVVEDSVPWAILVITDETEEQEKQQILQNALISAERASQAKSEFLSSISHDIRTPMNAIVGMVALAASHPDDKERVADCLQKVKSSSQHLLELISSVLDMSRMDSGKLELSNQCFHIRQRLHELYDMFQVQAENKRLTFQLELDSMQHVSVIGDELRFSQIIINLINNSLKFTEKGGRIHITAEELPCTRTGYGLYRISVRDTGIGIDPKWMSKLFEPFERVERSTVSKTEGSGLGLAIVNQLVDLMEGTIQVESQPGQGSCFTVCLPLAWSELPEESTALPERTTRDDMPFQSKRVLLVEDNEINMEIAQELLKMVGFTVEEAWNGEEAVQIFRAAPVYHYAIIITDIQMPKMDGFETSIAIRAMERQDAASIPIIAMTADATPEAKQRATEAGMNGYMTKPIDPSQLANMLKEFLS